jgi:hypothetical protein
MKMKRKNHAGPSTSVIKALTGSSIIAVSGKGGGFTAVGGRECHENTDTESESTA